MEYGRPPLGKGIDPRFRYAARVMRFRCPKELRVRVEAEAKIRGITVSTLLRTAVDTYLSAMAQKEEPAATGGPPPTRWGRW